jgi:hypothetical protein
MSATWTCAARTARRDTADGSFLTSSGLEVVRAEATTVDQSPIPGTATDAIRLHPDTIFTWGVEPGAEGMTRRRTV